MKAPPKPDRRRKKEALEEAIAHLGANAGNILSGPWFIADHHARRIFDEMQRGEMAGFDKVMGDRDAGDELAVAILSHLANLHISFDKPVPFALKCLIANRLFDFPMVRPNIVGGKINGSVAMKVRRGPKRWHNFLRDRALISAVRYIKEKYGYDAVRVVDKRTPDGRPSAASIVAEASKIVGMSADRPGKRGEKRGVDESTVSNLWNKRDDGFDR